MSGKRRKYSKNGCLACKRRKVKCDEGVPLCSRCAKLNLECIYMRSVKVQPALSNELPAPHQPQLVPDVAPIVTEYSTDQLLNLFANQELLVGDVMAADNRYQNNVVSPETPTFGTGSLGKMSKLPDIDMQDLPHSFIGPGDAQLDSDILFSYDYMANLGRSYNSMAARHYMESLNLNPTETIHFESFMRNVHLILNPFAETYMDSPFIKVFLDQVRSSRYLLNAMLASGARFLLDKSRTTRDSAAEMSSSTSQYIKGLDSQIEFHKKSRAHYLSNCYWFLHNSVKKSNNIPLEIEGNLLTSLLLTGELSSYPDDRWAEHLQGAQALLREYIGDNSLSSQLVLVAKYMFSSLEMSAWMFCSAGLEALDRKTLDKWLPIPLNHGPMKELKQCGIAIDGYRIEGGDVVPVIGSFKPYVGYNDDVADIIRHIIIARTEVAEKNVPSDPVMIARIFGLIDKARNFFVITDDIPAKIPIDSKFHPLYEGYDKAKAPLGCYFRLSRQGVDAKDSWFSFFDFCNRFRIDVLNLYMLVGTNFLNMPPENPVVQRLLRQTLKNLEFFVWYNFEIDEEQSRLLERFYTPNIYLTDSDGVCELDVTNGTFKLSEENLDRIWKARLNLALGSGIDFQKYMSSQIDHRICMVQWCLLITGYCCVKPADRILIEYLLVRLLQVGIKSSLSSLEKLTKNWTQRRLRYLDPSMRVLRLYPDYNDGFFFGQGRGFPYT